MRDVDAIRRRTMVASQFIGWYVNGIFFPRAFRYAICQSGQPLSHPYGVHCVIILNVQPLKRLATVVAPLRGALLYDDIVSQFIGRNTSIPQNAGSDGRSDLSR